LTHVVIGSLILNPAPSFLIGSRSSPPSRDVHRRQLRLRPNKRIAVRCRPEENTMAGVSGRCICTWWFESCPIDDAQPARKSMPPGFNTRHLLAAPSRRTGRRFSAKCSTPPLAITDRRLTRQGSSFALSTASTAEVRIGKMVAPNRDAKAAEPTPTAIFSDRAITRGDIAKPLLGGK
jgi:hypothetical protein